MRHVAQAIDMGQVSAMATSEIIGYSVRMPRDLKDAMKADAQRNSRSLNAHFVHILQLYFDGELVPVADLAKTPAVRNLIKEAVKEAIKKTAK